MSKDVVRVKLRSDAPQRLRAASSPALESIGPKVVSYAQRIVPIDTGELRSSIGYRIVEESSVPVLYIAAGLGSRGHYAAFVELGTSRQRAQPYLRPAAYRRWL